MPCNSDYLRRGADEEESVRVLGLLAEAGLDPNEGGPVDDYYGRKRTLDADVARLCARLKTFTIQQIKSMSLELQIWWRDHQIADSKREAAEAETVRQAKIRADALAKLTAAERSALGIR